MDETQTSRLQAMALAPWFIFTALYGAVLWGLYAASLPRVFAAWNGGDYSYAWLIPLVMLYIARENRDALSSAPLDAPWLGTAPLLAGIFLFWLGELGGEYTLLHISAWFVVVGLLWLHMGRTRTRILAFPLFLFLTAIPLPDFLHRQITLKLQLVSSQIGVLFLRALGVTAYREGNVIDIGYTQLQVVEACSGLRYVFPLLVLGLILAYFFRASLWKRALLVLSTIPLTILWNSMRIALTGYFWIDWGPQVAEGFFHDFSGWVIFVVSFGVLLGEMWLLGKVGRNGSPPGKGSRAASPQAGQAPEDESPIEEKGKDPGDTPVGSPLAFLGQRGQFARVAAALALLGCTFAVYRTVDFSPRIPIHRTLAAFPLEVSQWRGSRDFIEAKFVRELDVSDYTLIDYRNGKGESVNFYVAYYENQRKGESIHSPETCLIGGGWVFRETGASTLPVGAHGNGSLTVNRVVMEKIGQKSVAYFWFPMRGRILQNAYQLKLFNFWDALTRRRTDGALVRVLTPVGNGESIQEAESRLQGFLSQVVPLLDGFIPGANL